jgi:hypothetical protein
MYGEWGKRHHRHTLERLACQSLRSGHRCGGSTFPQPPHTSGPAGHESACSAAGPHLYFVAILLNKASHSEAERLVGPLRTRQPIQRPWCLVSVDLLFFLVTAYSDGHLPRRRCACSCFTLRTAARTNGCAHGGLATSAFGTTASLGGSVHAGGVVADLRSACVSPQTKEKWCARTMLAAIAAETVDELAGGVWSRDT